MPWASHTLSNAWLSLRKQDPLGSHHTCGLHWSEFLVLTAPSISPALSARICCSCDSLFRLNCAVLCCAVLCYCTALWYVTLCYALPITKT